MRIPPINQLEPARPNKARGRTIIAALATAAVTVGAVVLAGCSDDEATTASAPSATAAHKDPAAPTHPDAGEGIGP